jgi:hypothetical protein
LHGAAQFVLLPMGFATIKGITDGKQIIATE